MATPLATQGVAEGFRRRSVSRAKKYACSCVELIDARGRGAECADRWPPREFDEGLAMIQSFSESLVGMVLSPGNYVPQRQFQVPRDK